MMRTASERGDSRNWWCVHLPVQTLWPVAAGRWSERPAWSGSPARTRTPAPGRSSAAPAYTGTDCSCPDWEHWRSSPWGNWTHLNSRTDETGEWRNLLGRLVGPIISLFLVPAALWKASIARSMPAAAERSCRAPICVYRAPMLKSTLPFSKASVRWQDGTPVNESYLMDGQSRGRHYHQHLS